MSTLKPVVLNAGNPKFILKELKNCTALPHGKDHIDSMQGREANPSRVP